MKKLLLVTLCALSTSSIANDNDGHLSQSF